MSTSRIVRRRRKRRREKARMKNGKAVRKHARKAGRTGSIHAKKRHAKARGWSICSLNPTVHIEGLGL